MRMTDREKLDQIERIIAEMKRRIDAYHAGDRRDVPKRDVHEWLDAILTVTKRDCKHYNLKFKGHIAAPGYGQSYECNDCGEAMWSACGMKPIPYADMERPPELSIEDIR